MSTVDNLKHRFESFDTEQRHQHAGGGESNDVSGTLSLSPRTRYPVPYVNERREFDPQYDPRNTASSHPQEVRSGAVSPTPDSETSPPNFDSNMVNDTHSSSLPHRQSAIDNRAVQYFAQRKHNATSNLSFPDLGESMIITEADRKRRSVFQSNRKHRPFDEVSSESDGCGDSLDELLQEESSSTTPNPSRTTLSAIQEHTSALLGHMPSTGSLSYSTTKDNSLTSLENRTEGMFSTPDETSESNSESNKTNEQRGNDNTTLAQHPPQSSSYVKQWRTQHHPSAAEHKRSGESHFTVDMNASWCSQDPSSSTSKFTSPTTMTSPGDLPSNVAHSESEKRHGNFRSTRTLPLSKTVESVDHVARLEPNRTATSSSTSDESHSENAIEQTDLSLHDLCGESSSTDDIAWRNAVQLLSMRPELAKSVDQSRWLPLHIACMCPSPPPLFMTRALLYTNQQAAQEPDSGGRLPLHLIAASSCDPATMQLLIEACPESVYETDSQGWTPLHLMLKNFQVDITLEHCRVLLGLTNPDDSSGPASTNQNLLQRRGDHLALGPFELQRLVSRNNPVTRLAIEGRHEEAFKTFPADVQVCLRRLYYWKRKQRRLAGENNNRNTLELDETESIIEGEMNPAAYFTPTTRQLPIHIIVRRGLSEGRHTDQNADAEESTKNDPAPRFLELVRLFIAVYPKGLVARDGHGYTPLLTALIMTNGPPLQELVELLLGKRTSGYESLPPWATNMSLYNFSAERYLNPAMVATKNMHQLPLHIVAEEMGTKFSLLSTIQESYPGAIQVQDYRGRTPLHLLLHNYRRVPPDPRMVALLLSDRVAQTCDDDGKLPFDLLVDSAHNLPLEEPWIDDDSVGNSTVDCTAFRKFFQGAIIAAKNPNAGNQRDGDCFLWRLRSLPPWLRRQACSAAFVQDLLIEELARPAKCALVLLYGLLLGFLIATFRWQMVSFVVFNVPVSPWLTLAVYGFTAGLFFYQVIFWALCGSMSDFLHLCFFNFWRWVDLTAIILVTAATYMINNDPSLHEMILNVGTAATGVLWLSAVGFLASWWYGFAMFITAVYKITSLIFWPVAVAIISIVGFAEMFHMLAQVNCADALGDTSVCSVGDAYRVIYFLVSGEPLVDIGSPPMATGMMILTIFFITLFGLIILTVLAMVVVAGSKCDFDALASSCFWEPKLTFILFASSSRCTATSWLSIAFEDAWDISIKLLQGKDWKNERKHWYACCLRQPCPVAFLLRLVALVFVPMWLLAGLLTLGFLWPPQVRRLLFRPCLGGMTKGRIAPSSKEFYASQLQSMRNDVTHIRDMSYERSNDIQRDIREIKDILLLATME